MLDSILGQTGLTVYISLFALLIAGTVGLPVPEDIPLILGGIAAQKGHADFKIVLIVCYVATVLGDLIIFWFGRKFGTALSKRAWFYGKVPAERIEKIKQSLDKRRLVMIFLARHLFYLRTMTFLTCGAVKMSAVRFFVADAFAALVSVPLMVTLGFSFAEHQDELFAWLSRVKEWALLAGIIVIVGLLYYLWKKRQKVTS